MININMVKCILLDLDDTLLANSWRAMPAALGGVFRELRNELGTLGAIKAMRALSKARFSSPHGALNDKRFKEFFKVASGLSDDKCLEFFDSFFLKTLEKSKRHFQPIKAAQHFLRQVPKDIPLVLATNPILNEACTHLRIKWAGLNVSDFKFVTHSENMHYSKPEIGYYEEILERLKLDGISPENCLFIGNDAKNDGPAIQSKIATVLIKNHNSEQIRILKQTPSSSNLYQASWPAMTRLISTL